MKKWFAYGAMFFSLYFIFLIATMPAAWVVSFINLPKNSQVSELSGTVWQSYAKQVRIDDVDINNVSSELSFLSLLMLDPTIKLVFGGPLVSGPEGKLTASQLLKQIKITDVDITVAAHQISEKLNLAIPLQAHNLIELSVDEFMLGKPICQLMKGSIKWKKASITALSETVSLGALSAEVACEKGALTFIIAPENDLGLTFTAYLHHMTRASGSGHLKPSANFPEKLKPLLPFIGKADNQGRYRLNF
ncbi:type II secretion system protein N [Colwellia hornerae]|uniref:Type II secretion system protein N n=1 Tax=Colwellia hornerae TaxID=89402 RepID=A0A5C6QFB4_9GAMM|nr:type II secretion system protein N [Colwellia hornerae]TWX55229.1 type II secretion system protein N [Colwellia hornerae]TWX61229.1 type II secretion system protein N [Colwellia hornerae]TWX67724.1 type II secretion system protein N [Colwellia hornerae]